MIVEWSIGMIDGSKTEKRKRRGTKERTGKHGESENWKRKRQKKEGKGVFIVNKVNGGEG